MDSIEFNELFNLLQNCDEMDRIEAKSAAHGIGKSFLETVSAYSNEPGLGGGYLLLGITKNSEIQDFKYAITGISDPDKTINWGCKNINSPYKLTKWGFIYIT